jgi:hypothetical protein|eukprot:1074352-Prymnesium_polylepis.1
MQQVVSFQLRHIHAGVLLGHCGCGCEARSPDGSPMVRVFWCPTALLGVFSSGVGRAAHGLDGPVEAADSRYVE